jgi:predicted N-acetyltransferase YhbS
MIIRPETVADYAAIAALNLRAFDNRMGEPTIVALSRQRLSFDPELSLVAEIDGRIVGHVLFMPHTVRLMDSDIRAVNLAPIAVDPTIQRQGIGGTLIEEGHRIAREKGYAFSFLLGHTSYYPRFGYRTHAYGASSVEVQIATTDAPLQSRPPLEEDIPALTALWRHEENGVDFALLP